MSREIMAACLEEATSVWFGLMGNTDYIWSEMDDPLVAHDSDKQSIATIAVALYQERMRETNPVGFRLDKASKDVTKPATLIPSRYDGAVTFIPDIWKRSPAKPVTQER